MSASDYHEAREALLAEINGLRRDHPRVTNIPRRRLVTRMRVLTKLGRFGDVTAARQLLLDEAPTLAAEADSAAERLWSAWRRFVSDPAFTPEWLARRGPSREAPDSQLP